MSQTSYPNVSLPSRANGKAPAKGAAAAQAGRSSKGAQEPATAATSSVSAGRSTDSISQDSIAKRAYEKYVARGGAHGSDQDDWAAAERELIAEAGGR